MIVILGMHHYTPGAVGHTCAGRTRLCRWRAESRGTDTTTRPGQVVTAGAVAAQTDAVRVNKETLVDVWTQTVDGFLTHLYREKPVPLRHVSLRFISSYWSRTHNTIWTIRCRRR